MYKNESTVKDAIDGRDSWQRLCAKSDKELDELLEEYNLAFDKSKFLSPRYALIEFLYENLPKHFI